MLTMTQKRLATEIRALATDLIGLDRREDLTTADLEAEMQDIMSCLKERIAEIERIGYTVT